VPREKGIDDLRHDGLFIAHDALEKRSATLQPSQKVIPQLVLDRARCPSRIAERRLLQGSKCLWIRRRQGPNLRLPRGGIV